MSIESNFVKRANKDLSVGNFGEPPVPCDVLSLKPYDESQMVLRMLISKDAGKTLFVPDNLSWVFPLISMAQDKQNQLGLNSNQFVYLTVRHGFIKTKTDDVWHVDGFSMKIRHAPEQNYVWSSNNPTEYLDQEIVMPSDFDPMKHNVHKYFQAKANSDNVKLMDLSRVYLIDPYVIHRRPKLEDDVYRTFVRLSFCPIVIDSDKNTQNPLLPTEVGSSVDIRDTMVEYV